MKFLWAVIRDVFDERSAGGEIVAWHAVDGLRQIGHDAEWWVPGRDDLEALLEQTQPDVLVVASDFLPSHETAVRAARKKREREGLRVIVHVGEHRDKVRMYQVADLLISQWQGPTIDRLSKRTGKAVHYWPHACNPRYHYRVESSAAERVPIVFVGRYGHRDSDAYNQHIKPYEPDILLIGPDWPGRPASSVHFQQIAQVYGRAEKCLNFHNPEQRGPDRMLNARVFEIAACGRPQICDVPLPFDPLNADAAQQWAYNGQTVADRATELVNWL